MLGRDVMEISWERFLFPIKWHAKILKRFELRGDRIALRDMIPLVS